MTLVIQYICEGEDNGFNDPKLGKKASWFVLVGEELYRRDFSNPLLKCLNDSQSQYILDELHINICGLNSNSRITTTRILRVGY